MFVPKRNITDLEQRAHVATAATTVSSASRESPLASRRLLLGGISLASLLYLLGLFYYAHLRPIDGDEGYYTTAARLVWEGKVPYRDFAYQQSVLLPYIYSWIWEAYPKSLVAMRFLSGICGAIAILLWGVWLVSSRRFSTTVALATFAVILCNPYWAWWNIAVKTFALANLLASVTMICLFCALQTRKPYWHFVAGLALGACASARALYAPLVPVVFLWLLQMEWRSRDGLKGTRAFLGGATCGLLPMIVSFATGPKAFIFNNVSYRSLLSPHESLRHSVHVYLNNLISLLHHTYFVLTVLLALLGLLSLLRLRGGEHGPYNRKDYLFLQLALLMLVVYVATASIPFPVFDQYFTSPLLPFLVFFIAEGLRRCLLRFRMVILLVLVIMLPLLFLQGIKGESAEYAFTRNLQMDSFREVTKAVEANSREDDVVLSIWPGYVFESGRRYFPGSENQFNYDVGSKVSPEARSRYHLLSGTDVVDAISAGKMNVFVSSASKYYLDAIMPASERQRMRSALDLNYSFIGNFDGVEIYRRREAIPK